MSPAAERFEPLIFDSCHLGRALQFILVEMRPASRAREGSDIDENRDLMLAQEREEFLDGMRGMSDREDKFSPRL